MLKDEFDGLKKLSGNLDKIKKVLEMQEKGIERKEIIKETGFSSITALSNFMKRNGYRSENKKYIKEDITIESDNGQMVVRDKNDIKVREISDKSMSDILEIIKRKDDILKMLEWFDGVEEPVKVSNELKIEINASADKKDRKSIFFNPKLWNRFENFCKKNKQFKKHDIINQALYELLERVDNGE